MSTRTSIWLGHSGGKNVHIYWEMAERGTARNGLPGAPVYIAVESGNAETGVAIRLPREIATRLLTGLSDNYADEVGQVI